MESVQIKNFWDKVCENCVYDEADMTTDNVEELEVVSEIIGTREFDTIFLIGVATLCREIEVMRKMDLGKVSTIVLNDLIEGFVETAYRRITGLLSDTRTKVRKVTGDISRDDILRFIPEDTEIVLGIYKANALFESGLATYTKNKEIVGDIADIQEIDVFETGCMDSYMVRTDKGFSSIWFGEASIRMLGAMFSEKGEISISETPKGFVVRATPPNSKNILLSLNNVTGNLNLDQLRKFLKFLLI